MPFDDDHPEHDMAQEWLAQHPYPSTGTPEERAAWEAECSALEDDDEYDDDNLTTAERLEQRIDHNSYWLRELLFPWLSKARTDLDSLRQELAQLRAEVAQLGKEQRHQSGGAGAVTYTDTPPEQPAAGARCQSLDPANAAAGRRAAMPLLDQILEDFARELGGG